LKACALFLLTLLGGLVAASAGETAEHAPASSTAPAPPASVAIPVAEVATRAAEVPNLLRALTAPLAQSAEVETIRNQLPDLRRRIDTDTAAVVGILRRQPTLDVPKRSNSCGNAGSSRRPSGWRR